MKNLLKITTVASLLASPLLAENTQNVNLVSNDGSISLIGPLISYTNGIYVIETALGQFMFSDEAMQCKGAGCPAASVPSPPSADADPVDETG